MTLPPRTLAAPTSGPLWADDGRFGNGGSLDWIMAAVDEARNWQHMDQRATAPDMPPSRPAAPALIVIDGGRS